MACPFDSVVSSHVRTCHSPVRHGLCGTITIRAGEMAVLVPYAGDIASGNYFQNGNGCPETP